MGLMPILIPLVALAATGLGLFNVVMTNAPSPARASWSRRCFVLVFLSIAALCVIMVATWPRGVLPCGLAMAVLFLGVLWPARASIEEWGK